jgi:hypothetical protein
MVIEVYILRFRSSLAPSGLLTKVVLGTDMHKPAMHDYTFGPTASSRAFNKYMYPAFDVL